MAAVRGIDTFGSGTYVLNTGSPHYVQLVPDAAAVDVALQGRAIRYSIPYAEQGINVNFVSVRSAGTLYVRTYERGVEAETLSCGTGVTASALAYATQHPNLDKVHVHTRGGSLEVRFRRHPQQQDVFEDIYLSGAVQHVFDGVWVAR
jgi:diaminopimelate epimerase